MKKCLVYKTEKNYKVVCQLESVEGLFITYEPVYILKHDCKSEELSTAIFECLEVTKIGFKAPLGKEEYRDYLNFITQKLEVKSLDNLGKNSSSCQVIVDDNIVSIQPNEWIPGTGLVWVENSKLDFTYTIDHKIVVAEKIIEILNAH